MRPNIVVLLCDQLRPDVLRAYGCNAIPTPNIDRLAQNGVVFDNAITQSPVCAPARASMMTGRYPSDHRVWTNDVPFRDGLEYLPERMNRAGYRTGAFGKLHHTPALDVKGFQVARLMEGGRLGDQEPYLEWLRQRHPDAKGVFHPTEQLQSRLSEAEHHEHWIASRALEFMKTAARTDAEPFFAWISFQGPHTPLDPPPEVKGCCRADALPPRIRRRDPQICPVHRYRKVVYDMNSVYGLPPDWQPDAAGFRNMRCAYAEKVAAIDRQIGRILEQLESLQVLDRTTILFSADHGDLLGDFGHVTKGPFPYRGQLDIPLIVANAPELQPGTRCRRLVGNIDLAATCLDTAGDTPVFHQSRSLLRQAGAAPDPGREVNFSEYGDSCKIVENERYRYARYALLDFAELFDKEDDPDEQVNLAGRPETAALEIMFLRHLHDFAIIAKGVEIPAYEFVPEQQEELRRKSPGFEFDPEFRIAFPLSELMKERLREAGLRTDYNQFAEQRNRNE